MNHYVHMNIVYNMHHRHYHARYAISQYIVTLKTWESFSFPFEYHEYTHSVHQRISATY